MTSSLALSTFFSIMWTIVVAFAVPIVWPVVPLLGILLAILAVITGLQVLLTLVYTYKKKA